MDSGRPRSRWHSSHDDYANALALAAAVASKKPERPMFAGYGGRPRREERTPSAPPPSEPWVPGLGVVPAGSQPFYWTHEECGTQRRVDPSTEEEPYRYPRCQPGWTWRDVGYRGRLS